MIPGDIYLLAAVPDGRVFGLDQQTLISIAIMLLNAGVLAAALSFLLYKPVRAFMRQRAERIGAQLSSAEQGMAEADSLKAQYIKKLQEIETERFHVIEAAREAAAKRDTQMMNDTKREIAGLKERATADIQKERERLSDEISMYILEVSTSMAGKFVALTIDKETQDKMFREAIRELEEASWPS
jgi:F-type H+-transporting ATPase subunit b